MRTSSIIAAATLIAATSGVHAGTPEPEPVIAPAPAESNGWDFLLSIYSPMMGVDGTAGVGPLTGPIDIPFSDILSNLDAGFFSSFEARGNRWSVNGDIIWLKMSSSVAPTQRSYLGVKQEQFMTTLSTGYELYEDERTIFDIFGGAALTSLDLELNETTFTVRRGVLNRSASGSKTWIDPILGLRVRHHLSDRWTLFASGAYGGFGVGSEEYWQLIGGVSFRLTEHSSIALAYRGIGIDYHDSGFLYNTKTYGPNLGLVFNF